MPQTTSEPTEQPERSDSAASRRTTPDSDRPPWRVEGRRSPGGKAGRRLPPQRPCLWALLALLLILDWALVLAYQPSAPQRVTVPYSYFTQQIQAGNVASVTAQGSAIQGTFRHAVTYAGQSGTTSASQKATTKAYFAT